MSAGSTEFPSSTKRKRERDGRIRTDRIENTITEVSQEQKPRPFLSIGERKRKREREAELLAFRYNRWYIYIYISCGMISRKSFASFQDF